MVLATIKVDSQGDPFARILGLWLDEVPPLGWTYDLERQNTAFYKTFVYGKQTLNPNLVIADGKHTMYVAISQSDNSPLGPWKIEATFDRVVAPVLDNIDWNTLGRYDFTVKNGQVVTTTRQQNQELDDANKGNVIQKAFDTAVDWVNKHKASTALIAVGTTSAIATVMLAAGSGGGKRY